MPFVYLTFRHSVRPEGGQAFPTFGIRCWKLGGAAGAVPVVCGQVCDVSPNEAFVKALAGRCTREGLEPCPFALCGGRRPGGRPAGRIPMKENARRKMQQKVQYNIIVPCHACFC